MMMMVGERRTSRQTKVSSVHEARWLLGPILALALAFIVIGLFM
jgi:hypothetical protein